MAEYKRYITQIQENGSVMISEDVIAAIVEHSMKEVDGVTFHADVRKNWNKTMKIQIAEDNSVVITVNVAVTYGHSVVEVAKNVQNALTASVENRTGVKVAEINVNICGIIR